MTLLSQVCSCFEDLLRVGVSSGSGGSRGQQCRAHRRRRDSRSGHGAPPGLAGLCGQKSTVYCRTRLEGYCHNVRAWQRAGNFTNPSPAVIKTKDSGHLTELFYSLTVAVAPQNHLINRTSGNATPNQTVPTINNITNCSIY